MARLERTALSGVSLSNGRRGPCRDPRFVIEIGPEHGSAAVRIGCGRATI